MKKFWLWGGGILALALLLRLAFFVGVRSVEPVLTAWQARQVVTGSYAPSKVLPESVNGSRLGIVLPTAASIAIFGVNDRAVMLFPLLCGLATIAVVLALGRGIVGDRAALTAAGLLAVLPVEVLWSTQLYTDLPMSLCWAVAALLFLRGTTRCAVGAGLAVGLSWMMREPGILFLGVLALAGRRRMLAIASAAALSIVAIESVWYFASTGSPGYRIEIATSGLHAKYMTRDYYQEPGSVARRVFLELPSMLFNPADPSFLYYGGLPIAALFACRKTDGPSRFFALWWLAIFALFAFLPLQVRPWRPAMVLHPRTLLPLGVPAALFLARWAADRPRALALAAAVALLSGIGLWRLAPRHRGWQEESRRALAAIRHVRAAVIYADDTLAMGGHRANFVSYWRGFDPETTVVPAGLVGGAPQGTWLLAPEPPGPGWIPAGPPGLWYNSGVR